MTEPLGLSTIERLSRRTQEPAWLTERRRRALARHRELPWPHPSDDIWRRTDVSLLDPMREFALAEPPLTQGLPLSDGQLKELAQPLGEESLLVRINGSWLTQAAPTGVEVDELPRAAHRQPDALRRILEADGLTAAEQKLASLNDAFHHDDLWVQVAPGTAVAEPVRLVHLFSTSAKQAVFPLTIITAGIGSAVTLIDEYVSVDPAGSCEPHLVNARIELALEPGARVHYVRLQRWGPTAREFVLQRASLGEGAALTLANLNLGAALSKAHIATIFAAPHASSQLYGFVFGHGRQHVDQHTLQDHQAPHTTSDLQFRAALQDASRMVYTGLIRIAKAAAQTNAYQANHNLLLSEAAKAETIPMLEILADDVQCKHGASIGPIDEEQIFYLMSRGVPRAAAERLIVMGFIEPVIQQVPFEPLRERLREEIEGSLHS
jgi:Fe-S cluster assembly protein SufD